jgi:hypothetical protein
MWAAVSGAASAVTHKSTARRMLAYRDVLSRRLPLGALIARSAGVSLGQWSSRVNFWTTFADVRPSLVLVDSRFTMNGICWTCTSPVGWTSTIQSSQSTTALALRADQTSFSDVLRGTEATARHRCPGSLKSTTTHSMLLQLHAPLGVDLPSQVCPRGFASADQLRKAQVQFIKQL